MANAKMDLAELIRELRRLQKSSTLEDLEKADCYSTVLSKLPEILTPGNINTLIPITFHICPPEKANKYVVPLGMNVVEGGYGIVYLSFSKQELD